MSRSIDDVDLGILVIYGSVFGKDGDTSFTLNVVGVHNTFLYFLVVTEDTALL